MRQEDARSNISFLDYVSSYVNMIFHDMRLVYLISKRYRNYVQLIFSIVMKKYPINAITSNREKLIFHNFESFYNTLLGLDFDSERDVVYIRNYRFCGGMAHGDNIAGVFQRKEYSFLDVMGKTVIDIGAGIGDSAIYFIENGASRVISVEANQANYELAKRNIEANDMKDKVDLLWAACLAEDSENLNDVPAISLSKLLQSFTRGESLALKIDCEGCEYEILAPLSKDMLCRISHIQIEYHYGYRNLKRKLETSNFQVAHTKPRYFRPRNLRKGTIFYDNVERRNESMFLGWIYATNRAK